jgi:hypothetical protein
VFSIAVGILCAVIAPSRGRSAVNWLLLGVLFSVFALVALLALPGLTDRPAGNREGSGPDADTMACPRCAETIKRAASMCRFCQLDLSSATPAAVTPEEAPAKATLGPDDPLPTADDLVREALARRKRSAEAKA